MSQEAQKKAAVTGETLFENATKLAHSVKQSTQPKEIEAAILALARCAEEMRHLPDKALPSHYFFIYSTQANLLFAIGNYGEAAIAFSNATSYIMDSAQDVTDNQLYDFYSKKAFCYYMDKQYSFALENYNTAEKYIKDVSDDTTRIFFYSHRAQTHIDLKNTEQAKADLEKTKLYSNNAQNKALKLHLRTVEENFQELLKETTSHLGLNSSPLSTNSVVIYPRFFFTNNPTNANSTTGPSSSSEDTLNLNISPILENSVVIYPRFFFTNNPTNPNSTTAPSSSSENIVQLPPKNTNK